jgi:ankyrin repeat protein
VEELLRRNNIDVTAVDCEGDTALHKAACGHAMAAYLIAQAAPACVLTRNKHEKTPIDMAVGPTRSEVRACRALSPRLGSRADVLPFLS